jgi:hypothetical protein
VSLTVTEASAVATLLQFVAGGQLNPDRERLVDDIDFEEAVEVLVAKAYQTQMAGVAPRDVKRVVAKITGRLRALDSDGLAQVTCRALADHEAHGGTIPWPTVRRPFEEWKAAPIVSAAPAGGPCRGRRPVPGRHLHPVLSPAAPDYRPPRWLLRTCLVAGCVILGAALGWPGWQPFEIVVGAGLAAAGITGLTESRR